MRHSDARRTRYSATGRPRAANASFMNALSMPDRRRQHAGADVRHVGELEQPLHRAVLAEGAVQHGKHDVEAEAGHARVSSPLSAAAIDRDQRLVGGVGDEVRLASRTDRMRRRQARLLDHFGGGEHRRWPIGQRPAAVLLDADRDRLVARPIEVLEHRGRRRDRHFVLAGPAAEDDTDTELFHRTCLSTVLSAKCQVLSGVVSGQWSVSAVLPQGRELIIATTGHCSLPTPLGT